MKMSPNRFSKPSFTSKEIPEERERLEGKDKCEPNKDATAKPKERSIEREGFAESCPGTPWEEGLGEREKMRPS